MSFTKMVKRYFDSLRRELSNGGLGIVVAFLVFPEMDFYLLMLDVQSSCMVEKECVVKTVTKYTNVSLGRREKGRFHTMNVICC